MPQGYLPYTPVWLWKGDSAKRKSGEYLAEGKDEQFGVIEFTVGVDVFPEFRKAVAEVLEKDWSPFIRKVAGKLMHTEQEWSEVCYVPEQVCHSKNSPEYRYIAIH